ncbi:MAG: hypothetical protein PHS26_13335 [Actinomycetota bacterium]|nr:hypothetical protein [Actinomycetota bacterium]
MAHSLVNDYLAGLLGAYEPPCLSLYQRTHRHRPENQQDPILFRNLVKKLEESLQKQLAAREAKPLLEPFQSLAGDSAFWNNTLDGLAVFCAGGFFRVLKLQRPVPDIAVVANSFHIKPLVRIFQSADRYQVLCLNRKEIRLFEGDRHALDEVELAAGVPRTRADAIGEEHTEPHLTVASYGGADGPAMHHGHGSKKDEVDVDTERFFRVIDRAVLEHHSRPSGLPLMLAALPEHHSLFRKLSGNPFLMEVRVEVNPDALSADGLRERAWQAFEPQYKARLDSLVAEFEKARAKDLGSDDLKVVAKAALAGGVATMLIEADRHIPGRLDEETGKIRLDELEHPEVDDLLDDLTELVLKKGGRVVVVPAQRMPTRTGVAAVRRF